MNLIADTNVWYDIGAGNRNPVTLKFGGNRLVATPTSFMEISSLIDDHTIAERSQAAHAVVEHADMIAQNSELHLAALWGLPVSDPDVAWIEGFRAIAQASSANQLRNGVKDFQVMVQRTVDVQLSNAWRTYHWNDFRDKVIDALENEIPGYKSARNAGKCKHMKKEEGEKFAISLKSPECKKELLKATFCRALLVVQPGYREPSRDEYNRAEPLLLPYIDAYIEYLIGCATKFAPQSNDFGDSECFIYLQDGNALLSSDKRWVNIARNACRSHYLDPENKVP